VTEAGDGFVLLDDGKRVECDAVLWATQAASHPLLRDSGLAVDAAGFLRVRDTLQSVANPAVFGTGDCITIESRPGLPKNGVYAVREGAVLFDNVAAFLHEKPLRPFRPQPWYLTLLNTADDHALLRYGPFVLRGRWARRFKDRIDRAWMRKMTPALPAASASERILGEPARLRSRLVEPLMRCGGCGSKISGDVLSAVLKRLDLPDDPRVLLGVKGGEDAAVHRVKPELFGADPEHLLEVQTVDYFKAFLDDPYLFGRIAALNAVSDLYAMNARPFSALAIATIPDARGLIQEAQLYELLSGAVHTFRQAGVVLTGGHTTEGSDLALGFAVTGFAEEERLFQKSKLKPGDQLVLTKPLGSGALLAAWMRGECRADWFEPLIAGMLLSNGPASVIFRDAGVAACTDVTGFGLAGHLLEMLDASGVSTQLTTKAVRLYRGFDEVVSQGVVSSLHAGNARTARRVQGAAPAWLFDPQTSGGLLGAIPAETVAETLNALYQAGYPDAAMIGEIVPTPAGEAPAISLH
jgi:selenide,water dikinase